VEPEEAVESLSWGGFPEPGPTTTQTPIGLALEIDQGQGVPLEVRAGQRFFVNQIDLRASVFAAVDEGVDGLASAGDFAELDWEGSALADQSFVGQPNPDGTFIRRRFYRGAAWMEQPSWFSIEQIDAGGDRLAPPVVVGTGLEHKRLSADSFFVRRLRAIQWTYDCQSASSCEGAQAFEEEALVELRNANGSEPSFSVLPQTAALRVRWTALPDHPWVVPLTQVAAPAFDYGFQMDLQILTPPAPDGTYAPGQSITLQFTLMDGSGNRLHTPGVMPSYLELLTGQVTSGINYWRGFAEPFATYYRRKHREKQLNLAVMGPAQDLQPIYSVVDVFDLFGETVTTGTPAVDGVWAAAASVPSFAAILSGPSGWALPSTDTWTFTIPEDAAAGTYLAALKGRRSYLGEDTPKSHVISFQVGTTETTEASLPTGGCGACHSGGGSLGRVLHGLSDRRVCTACHMPLSFELEGPIHARLHFIHARSNRVDEPLARCSSCHLTNASIQRTSKSGCLSCHASYPPSHVEAYGPITDMYLGGGAESFQPCTSTCHTTHPASGL